MYEPSEEIKKQIAKENWEILRPGEDWETGGDIRLAFLMVADEAVKCPTINKALELFEAIPDETKKICGVFNSGFKPCCKYILGKNFPICGITGISLSYNSIDCEYEYEKCEGCPRPYKGEK